MVGKVEHELEVRVPASELWEIYGGLEVGKMVTKLLPDVFESVEVVEGDGGVGTVLNVIFPKGTSLVTYLKEKFIVIDNEKRVKVVEVIEGGFLDLGFSLYQVYLQIIEKDSKSSIIKSSIEYEVKPGSEANASFVSIQNLQLVAEAIGKYLTEKV
ncbi:S-norcoclaurine synthase [Thalictrum thalictroides]|uniref:S-norcoclaurine synthase n=1 Tax=Thalictrum thalictroides TaxID=46969 RepID=A0A7J6WK73_THATH|nr:S-norcoclaurine synthase [Thalictrum thalictroides]